MLTKTKIFKF